MLIDSRLQRTWFSYLRHELRTLVNAIIGYSEMLIEEIEEVEDLSFISDLQKIQVGGKQILCLINTILDPNQLKTHQCNFDIVKFGEGICLEFQAPLNLVVCSCESLSAKGKNSPFNSDIKKLHRAAQQLWSSLNYILTLSRRQLQKSGKESAQPLALSLDCAGNCENEDTLQKPEILNTICSLEEKQLTNVALHQGTILVVDDNEINRDLLSRHLERQGYRVDKVVNGKQALKMLEDRNYDLILLDIIMPEMNGYQVLEHLKSHETWRDIPVMMISALDETDNVVRCIEMGAVDYVPEPFNSVLLQARIEACLGKKRLRDQEVLYIEQLSQALDNLKATQKQLVESEKMAALGELVAGIAHEINTPIGVGVTAASTLAETTSDFWQMYQTGKMKRSQLEQFLDTALQSSHLILNNLNRAAQLIQSFKQVAVDQSSENRRTFNLKEYLEEILISLKPKLKRTQHRVEIQGDETLILDSYPGVFSQIVTNLVINSLIHGYSPDESGVIRLEVRREGEQIILSYSDDGHGIPPEHLGKIFEPFFTTKRSQGGSGLGLHLVYNLVHQKLKGSIDCDSKLGVGTTFTINFLDSTPP